MLPRIDRLVAVAAVALSLWAPAAFASVPKYQIRRVSMGPRPDQYVLVRAGREEAARPYALTGNREVRNVRRLVPRWSGARYIGPVWVTERVAE